MGIINTQAVADGRKVRTGKDGALYNGKGKLLATVEVFQAQMGVTNQKYHPLGTPLEQEILDSIGTTLTFTECPIYGRCNYSQQQQGTAPGMESQNCFFSGS